MPQLVKGGKYIFGWSLVKNNGEIQIPPEAFLEYGFSNDKEGILISGSKSSGGFGLSSKRLLENTSIGNNVLNNPDFLYYNIKEGEIKKINNRVFSWVKIHQHGFIKLSNLLLKLFHILINSKLLVGRGSSIALAFIAKGPIYEEAKRHPNISLY